MILKVTDWRIIWHLSNQKTNWWHIKWSLYESHGTQVIKIKLWLIKWTLYKNYDICVSLFSNVDGLRLPLPLSKPWYVIKLESLGPTSLGKVVQNLSLKVRTCPIIKSTPKKLPSSRHEFGITFSTALVSSFYQLD